MNKEMQEYSRKKEIFKWVPTLFILPVALYWILHWGTYSFIDNADLVIHEAGHIFFVFFGRFIYVLGGTLMQIILPSFITWYFIKTRYRTGVQFSLLWLGQNFINISVYAADAQKKALPLLGGNKVHHDWNYLLNALNILEYDQYAGYFFFGISIIIFLIAILMPLIIRE
jgi:hypothetical protein